MISKIKKPVSILLAVLMVISLFVAVPITASAADGTIYDSGSVNVEDLQAGDYITIGVGDVSDPNWEINLVLKGGTYWDGSNVGTDDLLAMGSDGYEIITENGRLFLENWGDQTNYYPYVYGEEADAFYVESVENGVVTLSGAKAPGVAAATYTVTWKNWNGTVLETDENVAEGATPTYDGETPVRPEDMNAPIPSMHGTTAQPPIWSA